MEEFIHQQNLLLLRKQLAETSLQTRRLQLLNLLAEEEAKNCSSPKEKQALSLYGRVRPAADGLSS